MMSDVVRRCVDIVVAVAVLVIGLPVFLVIAGGIRLTLGSPVLFSQIRAGKDKLPFHILKFRTMRHPAPGRESAEFDGERMTRFGRLLRSTSLDELPGFWNLLRGELTLVGPRPLPMTYLDRYLPHELARFDVKPGFTGLAQIGGRNAIGWDEKLQLDVDYVANRSLAGDLVIVVRTIPLVLLRRGISNEGAATMTPLPENRSGGARG